MQSRVRGTPGGESRGVERATKSTAQHQGLLAENCCSYNLPAEKVTSRSINGGSMPMTIFAVSAGLVVIPQYSAR